MNNKPLLRSLLGGALLLITAMPVIAQPAQSAQRGPRDSDGLRRGGRDRMERGERGPRTKSGLNRIWRDIADLEGGELALSRAQSAQVVALVLPVSKQQTLSDDAAQTLTDKIEAALTPAQRAEIDDERPRGRGKRGGPRADNERGPRPDGPPPRDGGPRDGGPRDGGPRDGGPRDGGPRDGGPRDGGPRDGRRGDGPPRLSAADREKVRPFMDALNPFYAPTGYATFKDLPAEFQKEVAARWGENRELLETLSKRAQSK